MAAPTKTLSVADQLDQLQAARKLALTTPVYYEKIVKGVLPIIGPTAPIELRRWGAEFLAESLATPVLAKNEKESLTIAVLDTIKALLESGDDDPIVLKASIGAAASAYPIVVRWIIFNSYHPDPWEQMSAIKSRVFRIWDTAPPPVKLACIKFAQRIVLAQTVSNGQEARLYPGLDVSLGMITGSHPILDPRRMEAEATGLLDRMLGVLQDNSSDALLVDGTLNCLSILIRTRPSTSNRIINCILNFNPLKLANSPMTPKTKVLVKSMEKTTRMLLIHIIKRDPNFQPGAPGSQQLGRIQQYIQRLERSKTEIFDEAGRKRALADQSSAQYGDTKRQRTETPAAVAVTIPPLGPGPHRYSALYTITNNAGLQSFDATQVPHQLATRIVVKTLSSISQGVLDFAIAGIRDRLKTFQPAPTPSFAGAPPPGAINPATAPLGVEEGDDDYEPNFNAAEDTEQILNKLDNAPPEVPLDHTEALDLGPFTLPSPPLLDPDTAIRLAQAAASRLFGPLSSLKEEGSRKPRAGINRLAASSYDRESWLTVVTRLATRSTAGLESNFKKEETGRLALNDTLREMLFVYILEDWRRRIEVAVAWLCEEWYNDQLIKLSGSGAPLNYEKYALRLIDGFLNYITPQDKVLTRFLAEIPELSRELLGKCKTLCGDPTTVNLTLTSMLYLVMMRPPVRAIALDTVAEIWQEYVDARPLAAKYLTKWRPGFIESQTIGQSSAAASA
ncbi:putative Pre-tRNA-processing protein [Podospora fimiseda]|uniref:Pre-tRNA-processing protein n=1 Tax=Podospora fimiseda TaxID=252190 RepID=A0AAN7BTC0_9PEZI|nr:putative Pre-tRNA-processing protein [Podospora fimiseda]